MAITASPASAESTGAAEMSLALRCTSLVSESCTAYQSTPSWKPGACPRISNGSKQQ